jgi:hypothetical protein
VKWFTVQIGGQNWRVDLVKGNHKALQHEGQRCHGICRFDEGKLYIAKEQPAPAREDTLLHELLHAVLYVSRGHHVLRDLCGDDEEQAYAAEEKLVEGLVLVLHPLLKDLGFKFPKVP